jgi:molybdopterin-guanine dinucleotide biosynthesis protein A
VSGPPQVFGLILAGGASSRMRRDKAGLSYQGKSALDRTYELALRHVAPVFVSVRGDQAGETHRAGKPQIVDTVSGGGPLVGIRSALAHTPGAAWLVLACDLPFLNDATIRHLLRSRDAARLATAYRSAHDGLPEPLCAIWEPAAAAAITAFEATGRTCPRKFLIGSDVHLIDPVDPRALDNINTPEDYERALRSLEARPETHPMQLKIQYFALMREQAGRSEETVDTTAATPAVLFAELNERYRFSLAPEQLKVAVNSEFAAWDRPLHAGDAVVFIPPVAGG